MLNAFSTPPSIVPRHSNVLQLQQQKSSPTAVKAPPPPIPPRRPTPPSNLHRESLGVFYLLLLAVAVLVSTVCVIYYYQRDRGVYEELVDYLEKSIEISKINYNPMLGLLSLRPEEVELMTEHRRYKSLMGLFSVSEFGNFALIGVLAFIYYWSDVQRTRACRVCFWLLLFFASCYTLVEATSFAVMIFPHSALPNATETMLDHATPHNPAGLLQMESRFGCTFNQNLYQANQRRQTAGNTCDPYLLGSFIPHHILVVFIVLRVVCLLTLLALLAGGLANTVGVAVARLVLKSRPVPGSYRGRYVKNPAGAGKSANGKFDSPHKSLGSSPTTIFGVADSRPTTTTILPSNSPLPGKVDHSISYNNAAIFATAGAFPATVPILYNQAPGMLAASSSRNSLGSDAPDILFNRNSTHTSSSIVSEV